MSSASRATLRALSPLAAAAAITLGCRTEPPTPVALGEAVQLGPFAVTVSRVESVPLTGSASPGGEGVGLAVFVRLTLPEPDPAVAAEIAALGEDERRIAQRIADLRFTRRDFDDSDLEDELARAVERREELEGEAYHEEERARLLPGGFRLLAAEGGDVSPTGYATEETYETQMRFRDGPAEEPFLMLAAGRQQASYNRGESPQEWVLLFRLPGAAEGLGLRIDNPSPTADQPGSVAVDLGRP